MASRRTQSPVLSKRTDSWSAFPSGSSTNLHAKLAERKLSAASQAQALQSHWDSLDSYLAQWSSKQEILLTSLASSELGTLLSQPTQDPNDTTSKERINEHQSANPRMVFDESAAKQDGAPLTLGASHNTASEWSKHRNKTQSMNATKILNDRSKTQFTLGDDGSKSKRTTIVKLIERTAKEAEVSGGLSQSPVALAQQHEWLKAAISGVTSFTMVVICANAIVIAFQANYGMDHLGKEDETLSNLELAFACCYVLEFALRIGFEPCTTLCGPERKWNWFDLLLALQAMYEQVWRLLEGDTWFNVSFLRLLRLLKLLKFLRFIRLLRAFRELRLMLTSLFGCMKALTWVAILVFVTTYTSSVIILQACVQTFHYFPGAIDTEARIGMDRYWSSVGQGMVTLFMATMNGQDWEILMLPLKPVGYFPQMVLVGYVFFSCYTVMNIMNAVFIEAMIDIASTDNKLMLQMEMEKTDGYVDKLSSLYDAIDLNDDGVVTLEEFEERCEHKEMVAFLATMQIDVTDATHFFRVLSQDGDLAVDIQTFVTGCMKLKGMARAVDLLELSSHHAHTSREIRRFMKETRLQFANLETAIEKACADSSPLINPEVAAAVDTSGQAATKPAKPSRSAPPGESDAAEQILVFEPPALPAVCKHTSASVPEVALRMVAAPALVHEDAVLPNGHVRPNFCSRCGGAVAAHFRFCRLCGTPVSTVQLDTGREPTLA